MSFDARNITQGGQVIKYMIGMFMQNPPKGGFFYVVSGLFE